MTTTLTRPIDLEPLDLPSSPRADGHRGAWAVLITGLAIFMASLDNLVVTTALPVIRVHLHAGLTAERHGGCRSTARRCTFLGLCLHATG